MLFLFTVEHERSAATLLGPDVTTARVAQVSANTTPFPRDVAQTSARAHVVGLARSGQPRGKTLRPYGSVGGQKPKTNGQMGTTR